PSKTAACSRPARSIPPSAVAARSLPTFLVPHTEMTVDGASSSSPTARSWSPVSPRRQPRIMTSPSHPTTRTALSTLRSAPVARNEATPLLAEAEARWQAVGVDTSSLQGIDIRIGDLGGTTLGLADEAHHAIWLDDDAAGWGWFVDPTPWE